MTATDELRRLLDERGVEWEATADTPDSLTTWATGSDTARWCADELINDRFDLYAYNVDEDVSGLTPAQAIDATLGPGTCHDVCAGISEFTCSSCGFSCDLTSWISLFDGDEGRHRHHHHGTPNYCPNCGKRVDNG